MPLALYCLSHTPVFGQVEPGPGVQAEVDAALSQAATEIDAFGPDLVVLFAPDHYNGFFFNLMPAFCIGTAATSIGDYASPLGTIKAAANEALDCASACLADGVDVAVSRAMTVDHGFAQPLALICGGIDRFPVIPVFINAVAQPVAPIARSRALGAAIGRFLARDRDRRVLVLASGGLSHDPPLPVLATAPEPVRERLIAGIARNAEEQAAHEQRVIGAARLYAEADPERGGGGISAPLNPEWDLNFLSMINAGKFDEIDAMNDHEISAVAGGSAHEVRCWVAAYACAAAYGSWRAETRYYRAIPQWMAGFAITSGEAH